MLTVMITEGEVQGDNTDQNMGQIPVTRVQASIGSSGQIPQQQAINATTITQPHNSANSNNVGSELGQQSQVDPGGYTNIW